MCVLKYVTKFQVFYIQFRFYNSLFTKPHNVTCKILGLVLVSHSWSRQSIADLGVVHHVLVLNLKSHYCKLIHVMIMHCLKLTGKTTTRCEDFTYKYHCCLCIDLMTVLLRPRS